VSNKIKVVKQIFKNRKTKKYFSMYGKSPIIPFFHKNISSKLFRDELIKEEIIKISRKKYKELRE